MDGPEPTPFEAAAARILRARGAAPPDSADLALVVETITRFLGGWRFAHDDAEEIAHDVIVRTLTLQSDRPFEIHRPGAYLFTAARHRALDRLRRDRHREIPLANMEPLDRYSADDDAVAALLDRSATASAIEFAIRAAAAAGDHVSIRVISSWLELAEELGREPTSREVAPLAGVSHTSVNQALRRIGGYFPEELARASIE